MNPIAEHLDANPGHYLRRDGTCHCDLKLGPLDFPLRTVRTSGNRRLYHYWSTVQGKALCRRNMRLTVLSDYAEGQPICADCVRVAERVSAAGHRFVPAGAVGPQEDQILHYVFGTPTPTVPVLRPHMRGQNTHPIRSRYRSRRVRS